MTEKLVALTNYTQSVIAIKQFKEKNKEVFEMYDELVNLKNEKEEDLKKTAKEVGDMDNGMIKVTKVNKYKKWYDVETLKKSPDWKTIEKEAYVIEEKVDKEKLDAMAKEGVVERKTLADAFREEEMSPSILIKVNI